MNSDGTEKRDVLLHFDENADEVIVFTVASEVAQEIRDSEFDGARIGTDSLKAKSADEAEKSLGSVAFTLLDKFSSKKIGIRDYEARIESAHQEYVAELQKLVRENDSEAFFRLGMERHRAAMSEKSPPLLEEADRLIRESAKLGFEEAREYMKNDWPQLREIILKRISRG